MSPTIARTEAVYSGWNTLHLATIRLDDGRVFQRVIEDHGHGAVVLPFDPARKCAILVRQFRPPVFLACGHTSVLEAIAGLLDGGEADATALREADEEAGLKLRTLEPVANAWSMPGVSTERLALFLAEYAEDDRVGAGGGLAHEHEDIEVVELPLVDLAAMVRRGEIDDLKTLVVIQALMLRRPDLF